MILYLELKQKENTGRGGEGRAVLQGKKKDRKKKPALFMQESYSELIKPGLDICLV